MGGMGIVGPWSSKIGSIGIVGPSSQPEQRPLTNVAIIHPLNQPFWHCCNTSMNCNTSFKLKSDLLLEYWNQMLTSFKIYFSALKWCGLCSMFMWIRIPWLQTSAELLKKSGTILRLRNQHKIGNLGRIPIHPDCCLKPRFQVRVGGLIIASSKCMNSPASPGLRTSQHKSEIEEWRHAKLPNASPGLKTCQHKSRMRNPQCGHLKHKFGMRTSQHKSGIVLRCPPDFQSAKWWWGWWKPHFMRVAGHEISSQWLSISDLGFKLMLSLTPQPQ